MNQSENPENSVNLEGLFGSLQASGGMEDEFDRLQELLVKPDILRMRNQIAKLEQEFPELWKMRDQIAKLEKEFPELWKLRDQIAKIEQEFPELLNLRDQVAKLEQKFAILESQSEEQKNIIRAIVPIISELLNRKFAEFKEELLEVLVPIIQEQTEEDQTLSIRISGLSKDSQDITQNHQDN